MESLKCNHNYATRVFPVRLPHAVYDRLVQQATAEGIGASTWARRVIRAALAAEGTPEIEARELGEVDRNAEWS